jgi:2-polyprenyl-3-methyl-5-hydroxy-6-metoxy-1,4-benzoquinol methylase
MDLYSDKDSGYFANSRPELLQFIPRNMHKVLDVGCGTGNFGALLKNRYNCEVWGIEPDERSAMIAQEKLDRVISSTFDDDISELNGQKFDLVCFNDVLEHLVAPKTALAIAKRFLAKDGYVLASIPNIRHIGVITTLLRDKDFKYQKFGVMDETHLRFFTAKSMVRLFESSGYEVLLIKGINKTSLPWLKSLLVSLQSDMQYPQFALLCKLKINQNNSY